MVKARVIYKGEWRQRDGRNALGLQDFAIGQQLAIVAAVNLGTPDRFFASGKIVDQHFEVRQGVGLAFVISHETNADVEQLAFVELQHLQAVVVTQQQEVIASIVSSDIMQVSGRVAQLGVEFCGQLVDVKLLAGQLLQMCLMGVP